MTTTDFAAKQREAERQDDKDCQNMFLGLVNRSKALSDWSASETKELMNALSQMNSRLGTVLGEIRNVRDSLQQQDG